MKDILKRVKDWLAACAISLVALGFFVGIPAMIIYVRVSTCGWQALFMECRITAPSNSTK